MTSPTTPDENSRFIPHYPAEPSLDRSKSIATMVDVTDTRPPDPRADWHVQMHSLLNLLSVITTGLEGIQVNSPRREMLAPLVSICREFQRGLENEKRTMHQVELYPANRDTIWNGLVAFIAGSGPEEDTVFQEESVEIIREALDILDEQVQSLVDRVREAPTWKQMPIAVIEDMLTRFFLAVSRASRGRYWVRFNHEPRLAPTDYRFRMDFESPDDQHIYIPALLPDTIRDLTANARKYTEPGGEIRLKLKDSGSSIELTVEDNGRGIPAEDLPRVVGKGERGSNVGPLETHGGGYGLTKAHALCHRFGGRMWIDSELGQGTKIIMRLPRPINGHASMKRRRTRPHINTPGSRRTA